MNSIIDLESCKPSGKPVNAKQKYPYKLPIRRKSQSLENDIACLSIILNQVGNENERQKRNPNGNNNHIIFKFYCFYFS